MTDPSATVELGVFGDLHGEFDLERDRHLARRYSALLCTGDLTPNGGRDRFDRALTLAHGLRELGAHTILGNHDGPSCFTGRRFPESYHRLSDALGDRDVGARRVELPELDLTLVGARPLSCGGPRIRFELPEHEGWDVERWSRELLDLLRAAESSRIVVLAHCGPTGLGDRRHDIYGCDFSREEGDWGDPDLRLALDAARAEGLPVLAVIAGHMHHELWGGGERTRVAREDGVLHVNAACVPRIDAAGYRAITVVRLGDGPAMARMEWHDARGRLARTEALE